MHTVHIIPYTVHIIPYTIPYTNVYIESQLWTGSLDRTIRVWDVGSGRCLGVLRGAPAAPTTLTTPLSTTPVPTPPTGNGHTEAVTCLELIPATPEAGSEAYIASGGGDGEVKLWRTNGEYVHTCSHGTCMITSLRCFQDTNSGPPLLLIGLNDGRIFLRSTLTMELLMIIDGSLHQHKPVWSIISIGQSCFASAGDSGYFLVCRITQAIQGSPAQ